VPRRLGDDRELVELVEDRQVLAVGGLELEDLRLGVLELEDESGCIVERRDDLVFSLPVASSMIGLPSSSTRTSRRILSPITPRSGKPIQNATTRPRKVRRLIRSIRPVQCANSPRAYGKRPASAGG
jgi:hypothetical protein